MMVNTNQDIIGEQCIMNDDNEKELFQQIESLALL